MGDGWPRRWLEPEEVSGKLYFDRFVNEVKYETNLAWTNDRRVPGPPTSDEPQERREIEGLDRMLAVIRARR